MPPKKAKSPKKGSAGKTKGDKDKDKDGAGAGAAGGGDGEAAGLPSREEMAEKLAELEKDKQKEEEWRSYMQLERDRVSAYWEIARREGEERVAELRHREREAEEAEERHAVQLKVYKQKVKHLVYEHGQQVAALRAEAEAAAALRDEERRREAETLANDKRALKREMREMEAARDDSVRALRLEHAKEVTKLRQEFESNAKELHQKYEKKMKLLRDEMELRRKQEVHEMEERKNSHINELMKKHEKAFAEIKTYYNDITHNNLDLIKTLKDGVAEMKRKEASNEKLMYEIAQENKRLSEPLSNALKEVEHLRHQLANYEKDKSSLAQTKARLSESEKQLRNLEWEHEVVEQRFARTQAERDELYTRFEQSVFAVQQKSGLKNLLLEKKLDMMCDQLEKKEAQLGEVLAASNLDPTTLDKLSKRLDDVLGSKNQLIRALQYDIAKVSKAHNDLIRVYEAKLAELGVPAEELGFRPLLTHTTPGPAGLVVGT
eukprot:jgi/Chlat1/4401/Chrsp29S04617